MSNHVNAIALNLYIHGRVERTLAGWLQEFPGIEFTPESSDDALTVKFFFLLPTKKKKLPSKIEVNPDHLSVWKLLFK